MAEARRVAMELRRALEENIKDELSDANKYAEQSAIAGDEFPVIRDILEEVSKDERDHAEKQQRLLKTLP